MNDGCHNHETEAMLGCRVDKFTREEEGNHVEEKEKRKRIDKFVTLFVNVKKNHIIHTNFLIFS